MGTFHSSVPLGTGKNSSGAYQRHQPEKTVLYKIVSEHLETFLGEVRDRYDKPLPKYVEKELRDYLKCGLLQYGFAKAVCKKCGRTILVAFSCKKRGACCSCSARRMCNGAAHLVDHVIPDVPVRQWVLSVPFELRLLLACRADAFGAMTSLFISEVFRWQRERAREDGLTKIRYGALVMQHRFGSSLNLNTHLHAVFPDGVFSRLASGIVEFHELRQPEPDDLEEIAFNVHQRFLRWLQRHGLLKNEAEDDDFLNEVSELSALEACAQGSLGLGNLVKKRSKPRNRNGDADEGGFEQRAVNGRVGASHGYSLYAGNAIDADDKDGRERLLRYCLRAPLSLERLSIGPDGNVIYQVKATRHGNETQRVMTPIQFMSRLVALIPPPFHPLLRYFGVFGPHSSWRKSIVPGVAPVAEQPHEHAQSGAPPAAELPRGGDVDSMLKMSADPTAPLNVLMPSAKESNKLAAVKDREPRSSAPWRIDWATLLKRVYQADVLACPCGGRLSFVALVTEPATAKEILQSMGLLTDLPPIARARSPDFYDEPPPVDWD